MSCSQMYFYKRNPKQSQKHRKHHTYYSCHLPKIKNKTINQNRLDFGQLINSHNYYKKTTIKLKRLLLHCKLKMFLDYTFVTLLCGFIPLILARQNIKGSKHSNTRHQKKKKKKSQHLIVVLKST